MIYLEHLNTPQAQVTPEHPSLYFGIVDWFAVRGFYKHFKANQNGKKQQKTRGSSLPRQW
jgi:hypothetical protein